MAQPVRLFVPDESPGPKLRRRKEGKVYQYRPTVRELVDRYLAYCSANGVHSDSTQNRVKHGLGVFATRYGPVAADTILAYQLTDWVQEHPEWKTAWTRRINMSQVRACFKWAAEQGRIPNDPFRGVKLPVGERGPEVTDDVLGKLCKAANKQLEWVIRFIRLTGCRVGEVCEMTWAALDLDRGVWTIRKHKTRSKTRKEKYVALVAEAVALLRALPAGGPGDVVFKNTWGRPWTPKNVHLQMDRLRKRLGIVQKATPKAVRHRYGSAWIQAGGSGELLAGQLGHASFQTTERYYVDLSRQVDAVRDQAKLAVPKF